MVICLEQYADLHTAQLMPLPLTVSCFSKIQIGFTFLVPAHLGSPGQRAVKRVCGWVCVCVRPFIAKFHYMGPTGPDRTRPNRVSDKVRRPQTRFLLRPRLCLVGSGRACVVELSCYTLQPTVQPVAQPAGRNVLNIRIINK